MQYGRFAKVGGSSSTSSSPQIQFARMMQVDAEKRFLDAHAEKLRNGTEGVQRRIRKNAKDAGHKAYSAALEKAISTTESEKQTMIKLIERSQRDTSRAVDELRRLGRRSSKRSRR